MKNILLHNNFDDYQFFLKENNVLNNNISYVETDLHMIKNRAKAYYTNFDLAITDINNGTIGLNGSNTNESAVCEVLFLNSNIELSLLTDVEATVTLNSNYNINILLNEKTINSKCNTFMLSNTVASISNGKIICEPTSYDVEAYCIIVNSKKNEINNVEIISTTNGGGIKDNPTSLIMIKNEGILNIMNSTLEITDIDSGSVSNIYVNHNSILNAYNTSFTLTSPNGISANIHSNGNVYATECTLYAYANHTANDAGTDYATLSRAILSLNGNINLKNCNVYGTHSGVTIRNGQLYINGGTYDGYSHGGLYLGNGNCKSYIYNASINDCDLRGEGMYDDGVAGTNHAGMYIGGAINMIIYMDKCNIYGLQQPIVLKHSSSSSYNNHIYVSNTNINLDYKNYGVRNDGNNYVTFGVNNNFNNTNLRYNRNYYETNEEFYYTL